MRMSEKCCNNNSDNPLTSRRTNGGKNKFDLVSTNNDFRFGELDREFQVPSFVIRV